MQEKPVISPRNPQRSTLELITFARIVALHA